jgi:SAM-dependent methyltransferase
VTQNPYDALAYPSLIFRDCRPDRLAVLAHLHGLTPPPVATARMLEVGGGDGLNSIALATAFPHAAFVNIDIAEQPVVRGRSWTAVLNLDNMQHEVLDILDAPDMLDGTFDYITAHGVYAWVPEPVRDGLMRLFGRLLSPNGIAYVSYNAMPGGHTRLALRDLLLHQVGDISDPAARLAAARKFLTGFVQPQPRDEPIITVLRKEAEATLALDPAQLFHDQLGTFYAPQHLSDAVAAGARHGLRYLGDTSPGGQDQGFVDPRHAGLDDAALVRALQGHDYRHGRYFRKSVFVRQEQPITRVLDGQQARSLWATSSATHMGGNRFRVGNAERHLADARMGEMVQRLIAAAPGRVPVADLTDDPASLTMLADLSLANYVELHTTPAPFAMEASARPTASALARMQLNAGETKIVTLDHRRVALEQEPFRQALMMMDGSHDRGELERRWASIPGAGSLRFDRVLAEAARRALLIR